MVKRILKKQIQDSKASILLLGPRQTGKTTLLLLLKPDLVINLAREREFQEHLSNPSLIEDLIELKKPKLVFVDEIQRIPSLLNTIQAVIDEQKIRFLITGSSARKLKRGQTNLLPGRVVNKQLFSLTMKELNYKMDKEEAVRYGFLPGIIQEPSENVKQDILTSYVSNYLKEEIQQEALTRNLSGYSRFINYLPEWSGKVLDYSKISAKNKLNRFAVHRFFEIFEDTLLGERINSWTPSEEIKTVKHPKFYFFDNGVMNGINANYQPLGDMLGVCCETIIFNQIKASLSYKNKPFKISFFRTHSGVEVDFIVEHDKNILAIEVKASEKLSSDDVGYLKIVKSHDSKIHPILFHFGKKSFKVDGVWCLNWIEGLKEYFD